MKGKKELPEWDDGRTIANMNVEGMPWHTPAENRKMPGENRDPEMPGRSIDPNLPEQPVLSGKETWFFTAGALKAAFLVVGVMCLAIVIAVAAMLALWK